jgi:excisionase family DNA binding protein
MTTRWVVPVVLDEHGVPAVMISSAEAAALHRSLARAVDALAYRDGDVPPALRKLRREVSEAATRFRMAEAAREVVEQGTSGPAALDVDGVRTMSTTQAAVRIGCSSRWVRNLVATGQLRASDSGAGYRISESDVEDYVENMKGSR